MTPRFRRWVRAGAVALGALIAARAGFTWMTSIPAPAGVTIPIARVQVRGAVAHFADSYLRRRGGLWEMGLAGPPAARGDAIATLLRRPMIDDEHAMYEQFARDVPLSLARWTLVDLGRLKFRHVDRGIPVDERDELAGIALGFQPDPYASLLPTYHRFVFLYAVYDIALSFEKSPLIGCTTFTVPRAPAIAASATAPSTSPTPGMSNPIATTAGHAMLARAFDFEAGDVFDRDKVVYLVREPGKIPFASVGWPGFVGVVSGMNREGVAVVVHGGRAGTPRTEGIPVVFSLREVLTRAKTTDEAIAILSAQAVLVSHIVIVSDAAGDAAVVERAPGVAAFVRRSHQPLATSNHFEGPLGDDPRDAEVRRTTSTLARRARGDALIAGLTSAPTVADMVAMLRDRRDAGGGPLALGDRRAIDALIATHGVVMDSTARALWVSEWPHLLGRFVRFDLEALFAEDFDPDRDSTANDSGALVAVPADALLTEGWYAIHRAGLQ